MNRKTINDGQFHAKAQPRAESHIESPHDAERIPPPYSLPQRAGEDASRHSSPQCNGNGEPQPLGRQVEDLSKLRRRSGDYNGVEAEQKAAQGSYGCAAEKA